jgi:hypothetical protein
LVPVKVTREVNWAAELSAVARIIKAVINTPAAGLGIP